MMKVKVSLMVLIALLFFTVYIFAEEKTSTTKQTSGDLLFAVNLENTLCPVSGERVGGMGPVERTEYKGKIYNFCCAGCVGAFKEDPEKYVEIIEKQTRQNEGMDSLPEDGKHQTEKGQMVKTMMMGSEKKERTRSVGEEFGSVVPVKEFSLEAYQFGYSPEIISVNKGDFVRLHVTSRDVPHGVFIKEYGIDKRAEKGKVETIEFFADKTGEFDITCSVYCGRGHSGMKGKLIVTE